MKTSVFGLMFIFCIFVGTAQDCNNYYPMIEGLAAQVTSYDKKGKAVAVVDYEIKEVRSNGDEKIATISSVVKDKKGDLITNSIFDVRCNGEVVSIDFKSLMSPQLMEQYKNMDFELTGTDIIIPNDLKVGDKLPDSNMEMIMNMAGMNMKMNVIMKDREVTGQENITTPAGSFDCHVITYTSQFNMGITKTGTSKQWLAKDVGMVKQEDYNGNGKLTSSSLLTAFSK